MDAEQLRVYFPYQRVLDGMYSIYQSIFGLKFEPVEPPYKWIGDLQLYAVSDAQTGEPLGLFYLDMFPRKGKYNHFAHFRLIEGKLLASGKYQRPTVALICNFPSPTKDKPSLLSHSEVETIFHEFGHAMHSVMTRAKYGRFSGTSVPGDFVEAPSQMLENWVWDKKVLDSFAADYRDTSKKIPADILALLRRQPHRLPVHFRLRPDIHQQPLHGADVPHPRNPLQRHRLLGQQRRRQCRQRRILRSVGWDLSLEGCSARDHKLIH